MFWIKHLNHLRRDKVVIYDRYYYDFLIDPERCALNVSPYLVKLSYKLLIPKPSITIYVTVPPQLAFQRKGELGLEESEILQNKYLENKNIWSESVVIDNIKLDTSILMFKNALVHGITSDLGDYVVK
jgi:thymidylate kinase